MGNSRESSIEIIYCICRKIYDFGQRNLHKNQSNSLAIIIEIAYTIEMIFLSLCKSLLSQRVFCSHNLHKPLIHMRRPIPDWSIILNHQFEERKQELLQVNHTLSCCLQTSADGHCYMTAGEFRSTLSRLQTCLNRVEQNIADLRLYQFSAADRN
jgi:hypothetical protein